MAEDVLHELIKQAETLTSDEQLRLMAHIEKMVRQRDPDEITRRLWGKIQRQREEILKIAAKRGASNVRVASIEVRGHTPPLGEVNFLVKLQPKRSLLDLAGLMVDLQELLGCQVYVTSEGGLKDEERERVLQEAIPV